MNLLILKIKLLLQTIFIALLMLWQNDYYSNGKPIQGHHTFSVSKYPHLAGKGEGIYPATNNEHLNGWHCGNYSNSLPGKPIKLFLDF